MGGHLADGPAVSGTCYHPFCLSGVAVLPEPTLNFCKVLNYSLELVTSLCVIFASVRRTGVI